MVGEFDLIARIWSRLSVDPHPDAPAELGRAASPDSGVLLGIGDDAALLSVSEGNSLVACTDTLLSGVHFPAETPLHHVAYKAVAVNISDLAAMGAAPRWLLLSLVLTDAEVDGIDQLVDGLVDACAEYRVALVGGDTCRGESFALTVQALGELESGTGMRRAGAIEGDRLLLSGSIGDAALALQQGLAGLPQPRLLGRLQRPTARVSLGRRMRGLASACIDISDGLAADAAHLAQASSVAAVIEADRLPLSEAFLAHCPPDQRDVLSLSGGDDYELLFSVPPAQLAAARSAAAAVGVPLTEIGQIESGSGVTVTRKGRPVEGLAGGFDHFR